MTEIVTANFHELEVLRIAWQAVKFTADKWLYFSKQRKTLAECHVARSQCEAQKLVLAYVLVLAFAALLIGSMFYAITPRSLRAGA